MIHTPAVGLDLGGTNLRAVALDTGHGVVASASRPRPDSPDAIVDAIVELVGSIEDRAGQTASCIGVGCAGLVDSSGTVRRSPNIAELVDFPLRATLADRLGQPVTVDNDATVAALAEARAGAAVGVDHVVFVALGTGIGAALIIDGRLMRGASGFAGEAGHMIVAADGVPCVCGRRGCWERYVSGSALQRLTREAVAEGRVPGLLERARADGRAHVTNDDVARGVADREPGALGLLAELGRWAGLGLGNLVNLLDPELIVVGGGLSDLGRPLLAEIQAGYLAAMVDADARNPVTIRLAELGSDGGAIGAALLARETRGSDAPTE